MPYLNDELTETVNFAGLVAAVLLTTLVFYPAVPAESADLSEAISEYVNGNDAEARSILTEVLEESPENEKALELYRETGGDPGKFQSGREGASLLEGSGTGSSDGAGSANSSRKQTLGDEVPEEISPAAPGSRNISPDDLKVFDKASPNTSSTGGSSLFKTKSEPIRGEKSSASTERLAGSSKALAELEADTPTSEVSFSPVPESERSPGTVAKLPEKSSALEQTEFFNRNYSTPTGSRLPEAVYGIKSRKYDGFVRVIIEASGTVNYISSHIYNPSMLILDVPNTVNRLPDSPLPLDFGNLLRVRHSQYRIDPVKTTRVVLDLEEWTENYRIYRVSPGNRVVVDVYESEKKMREYSPTGVAGPRAETTTSDTSGESPGTLKPSLREQERSQQFQVVSGAGQSVTAGSKQPVPLKVQLNDTRGEPVEGKDVNFEVLRGDGQLTTGDTSTAGSAVTNENGVARARFLPGKVAGRTVVVARVTGEKMATDFEVVVEPAQPRQIEKVSGHRQVARMGRDAPEPLAVVVRDTYGNPVPGVRVNFQDLTRKGLLVVSRQRQGITASVVTDSQGRAEVKTYQAPSDERTAEVEASVRTSDGELKTVFEIEARPQLISVDFKDANLRDVLRTLAEIADWNLALAEQSAQRPLSEMYVTVHLTKVTALRALDTILDLKNLSRVNDGSVMKIIDKTRATRKGVPVISPEQLSEHPGNNMVTVTYSLRYLTANSQLASRIQNGLMAEESSIIADDASNSLVITDLVNNQRRIYQILQNIDQPDQQFMVKVVNLEHSNPEDITQRLSNLLPLARDAQVVPNRRTNSLLIYGEQQLIDRVNKIVSILDNPGRLRKHYRFIDMTGHDEERVAEIVNAILGLEFVPIEQLTELQVDFEDAEEVMSFLRESRTVDLEEILSTAQIIPLSQLNQILLFGPEDLMDTAEDMIKHIRRRSSDQVLTQKYKWYQPRSLPVSEARQFVNKIGNVQVETHLESSGAMLLSATNEEILGRTLEFLKKIDTSEVTELGYDIVVYSPQYVSDAGQLAEDVVTYFEDMDDAAGLQSERPRLITSDENRFVFAVKSSDADFLRKIINKLDQDTYENHEILSYAPRFIDAQTLVGEVQNKNLGRVIYSDENRLTLMVPADRKQEIREILEKADSRGYVTQVYQLRNTRAGELLETLNSVESHTDLNVSFSADQTTNSIIYTAPKHAVSHVKNLLEKLDQWQRQVFIEGVILEYTLGDDQEFGARWIVNPEKQGTESPLSGDVEAYGSDAGASLDAQGQFQAILNGDQFQSVLRFLQEEREAEVMAKPQISALNNEQATFQKGIERQERIAVGTGEDREITLQPVEALIELTVTPTITRDRFVLMDLLVTKDDDASEGDQIRTDRRRLENSVLIQDGHTVVLGGLIEEEKRITETGVPLLKDVPVLGQLFKSTNESLQKNELIVFLTPYVIEDPAEAERTTRMISDQLTQITPVPINVNVDGADKISQIEGLAEEESGRREIAENIVKFRQNRGPLDEMRDILQVPGVDREVLSELMAQDLTLEVDLNTVSAEDLMNIKNINPDAARRIVAVRSSKQIFRSLDEVREILLDNGVKSDYYEEKLAPVFTVSASDDVQSVDSSEAESSEEKQNEDGSRQSLPDLEKF